MELIPNGFISNRSTPHEYTIPDILLYRYMIHCISKKYGISKREASLHREIDFWEMIGFENMDRVKEDYMIKSLRDEVSF
jgi:hypothetical protein